MACITPIRIVQNDQEFYVPCRKCIGCIKRARNDWTNRFFAELKKHFNIGTFVTLTYNEDEVPRNDLGHMTLVKDDLQKFFKRLRHRELPLRMYAIGEYGTKRGRPHYHYFDFGNPLEDAYYDAISNWPYGNVRVGEIVSERIGYMANFHVVANKRWNDKTEQAKEFTVCSHHLGEPSDDVLYKVMNDGWYQRNGIKYSIPENWMKKLSNEARERIALRNQEYYLVEQAKEQALSPMERRILLERRLAAERQLRYKTRKNRK